MKTIGRQLISKRKRGILRDKEGFETTAEGDVETWNGLDGKDLLSVLIKANMDTDLPESQRLPDEDVLARTSRTLPLLHCISSCYGN